MAGKLTLHCMTLCLILMQVTANSEIKPRVVGGIRANRGEYPYMVIVERKDYKCSGTLIASEWALTAGHCTKVEDVTLYWITAGVVTYYQGGPTWQERDVQRIVRHPKFRHIQKGNLDITFYDISLLKVAEPFIFDKFINKISLPTIRGPYLGQACIGLGFGDAKVRPSVFAALLPPGVVRKGSGNLRLMNFSMTPIPCTDFGDERWQEIYQICSFGGEVKVMHLYIGDSGGPLVCNGVQVGIFSLLEGKWFKNKHYIAQIHTSVYHFLCWIREHVNEIKFDGPCLLEDPAKMTTSRPEL